MLGKGVNIGLNFIFRKINFVPITSGCILCYGESKTANFKISSGVPRTAFNAVCRFKFVSFALVWCTHSQSDDLFILFFGNQTQERRGFDK